MLVFILIFTSICLFLHYIHVKLNKGKHKTPPGPQTYTLIGDLLQVFKLKNGADFLKLLTEYTTSFNYIFYTPVLFFGNFCGIARPDHMQIILNSKAALNKPRFVYSRLKFLEDSMVMAPVELWQQRRKLFAPAFHQLSVNRYFNKFSHLTHNRFCPMLDDKYADKDYFLVKDLISFHFALGVMETMAGIDTTKVDPDLIMNTIHTVDRMVDRVSGNVTSHVKDLVQEFFLGKLRNSDSQHLRDYAVKLLDIYEEQKNLQGEGSGDLLSLGIETLKTLPREELLDELQAIIVGAYETISVTTCYIIVLLAMHPNIQDKIYEEMKNIFGDSDRPATEKDLKNMVYLRACIKESMRLYPSGTFVLRETSEDVKLDDEYTIPSGTTIFILIYLLHRNPSVWKNPDVFDPENFSPENSQKIDPYSYIPFSAGPRNCLGYKFAMVMMKLTMSAMIRKYHLETDMNMSELKFDRMFALRANHLRIRLKTRCQ